MLWQDSYLGSTPRPAFAGNRVLINDLRRRPMFESEFIEDRFVEDDDVKKKTCFYQLYQQENSLKAIKSYTLNCRVKCVHLSHQYPRTEQRNSGDRCVSLLPILEKIGASGTRIFGECRAARVGSR